MTTNQTYLSFFWCLLFLVWTNKDRLHGSVLKRWGKYRKKNNSVNESGLNSSFFLPYRWIKLKQNKRVKQVSPVLISPPSARAPTNRY